MLLRQENPDPLEQFAILHTQRRLEVGRELLLVSVGEQGHRESRSLFWGCFQERGTILQPQNHRLMKMAQSFLVGSWVLPGWL